MNDDKQAKDYNIEGGSVLHLVRPRLATRAVDAALRLTSSIAGAGAAWRARAGLLGRVARRRVTVGSSWWPGCAASANSVFLAESR